MDRQKEMWKNVGVNIRIQQKKLNQQDTCQVTSVTCFALEILIPASKDKQTRKNLKARTRKNVYYCSFKTIIQ